MARNAMRIKFKRMMTILNQNSSGRRYEQKCIDMGDSGYYRINEWFDVEINPSCIPKKEVASVFLWLCYVKPNRYHYMQTVACVRMIPFDEVDRVVQTWINEIQNQELLSYMEMEMTKAALYDVCKMPNKPIVS